MDPMQEIFQRLVKIETLLENLPKATSLEIANLEDKLKVANHRLDDIEKNNTWLWRAFGGALIAGVVGLLFK